MTGQELLLDLLGYVGIQTFKTFGNSAALNRPSVRAGDIRRGLAAINAALQHIYEKGPTEFKQDRRSVKLYAPTPVILTIAGNGIITMTTGKADWMVGCSIQISGDPYQNEILGFSGNDVSTLRAHPGSPGTGISATVYCDAVLLENDVKSVLEPVELPPNRRLTPAQSRADFDHFSYQSNSSSTPATSVTKGVGSPIIYWVEPYYSLVQSYLPIYIRVNPMPNQLYSLIFRAEHKPENVDESIYGANDQDPGYEFTSVPADQVERILLPIARYHFMAHPNFKNREARQSITDEAKEVLDSLTVGSANFSPSRRAVRARYHGAATGRCR